MPELISLDRILQMGPEVTPGSTVPATMQFTTMKLQPSIKATAIPFMGQGQKYVNVEQYNMEWTEGALTFQPSYGEIIYPLSGLLGVPTFTTPAGGFRSRRQTWNVLGTVGDTPKTFSVETGDSVGAETFPYGLFNSFGLSFARNQITGTGSLFGQKTNAAGSLTTLTATSAVQTLTITGSPTGGTFTLTWQGQTTAGIAYNANAATVQAALVALSNIGSGNVVVAGTAMPGGSMTITFAGSLGNQVIPLITGSGASLTGGSTPAPAIANTTPGVAITPEPGGVQIITPNQIDMYIDSSSANFGTTKMLRSWKFDFSIADKYDRAFPLNSANSSFVVAPEKAPKAEVKITISSDAQGLDLLTAIRAGTTRYVRLNCTGALIEGVINYGLTLDVAIKVRDVGQVSNFSGLYVREFTADMVQDYSWGQAAKIVTTNLITSLL